MATARRAIVRPPAPATTNVQRQRRLQKLRSRLDQERQALARWQKRFKRALNAVLKRQDALVRIEKQITKLEGA